MATGSGMKEPSQQPKEQLCEDVCDRKQQANNQRSNYEDICDRKQPMKAVNPRVCLRYRLGNYLSMLKESLWDKQLKVKVLILLMYEVQARKLFEHVK